MAEKSPKSPLEVWESLKETDPKYTKKFSRGGGFSGTVINPQYRWLRLTQAFGPCGIGWGLKDCKVSHVPIQQTEETMVIVEVIGWFNYNDATHYTPPGFGQDYLVKDTRNGLRSDDEAIKKATTDAIGNAFKYLGLGSDVYMGLYDDDKYVNELTEKLAEEAEPKDGNEKTASKETPPKKAAAKKDGGEVIAEEFLKDGYVDGMEKSTPNMAPVPPDEAWGDAAKIFTTFLDKTFVSDLEALGSYWVRNTKMLSNMQQADPEAFEIVKKGLYKWALDLLGKFKTETKLTTGWNKIKSKVNGMKNSEPVLYEAIVEAFRERKKQIKEEAGGTEE